MPFKSAEWRLDRKQKSLTDVSERKFTLDKSPIREKQPRQLL